MKSRFKNSSPGNEKEYSYSMRDKLVLIEVFCRSLLTMFRIFVILTSTSESNQPQALKDTFTA